MSYSIKKQEIIKYLPSYLDAFTVFSYDWIDNLNFTLDPSECLSNSREYLEIVEKRFSEAGWHGDGEIKLMWIPPFMLEEKLQIIHTEGVTIWHVKQKSDGISWILSPLQIFK